MKTAKDWKDFSVIATNSGEKLERWGDVILLRPEPQAIWSGIPLNEYKGISARYIRSKTGGGAWENYAKYPAQWTISWRDLNFRIKPMGFKHTGLFPEQAVNWDIMIDLIKNAKREISVLNLFAYTGGATVACLSAGATVCHVDAAKAMVERAGDNVKLSNLENAGVRYIVDDCFKFVQREIKRGKKYDAIIMDPPSYGRGPNGEMWKIEEGLFSLVELCKQVLSDNPLFFLINSYTTGLQPAVLKNVLSRVLKDCNGNVTAYEVGLKTEEEDILLPCGASGLFYTGNIKL